MKANKTEERAGNGGCVGGGSGRIAPRRSLPTVLHLEANRRLTDCDEDSAGPAIAKLAKTGAESTRKCLKALSRQIEVCDSPVGSKRRAKWRPSGMLGHAGNMQTCSRGGSVNLPSDNSYLPDSP